MSRLTNNINRLIQGVDKLNKFETPEQIAEFFRDMGYKGWCGNPAECLVSVFLKDCMGDPDAQVRTGYHTASYRWDSKDGEENLVQLAVNSPVSAFIGAFDSEVWPELMTP